MVPFAAGVLLLNVAFLGWKAREIADAYVGVGPIALVSGGALCGLIPLAVGAVDAASTSALGVLGFALAYIDSQTRRLPTQLIAILSLQILGILCAQILGVSNAAMLESSLPSEAEVSPADSLIGAAIWLLVLGGGAVFGLVGMGDVLLAPALGAFASDLAVLSLGVAFTTAAAQAVVVRWAGGRRFAFGPHLLAGVYLVHLLVGSAKLGT